MKFPKMIAGPCYSKQKHSSRSQGKAEIVLSAANQGCGDCLPISQLQYKLDPAKYDLCMHNASPCLAVSHQGREMCVSNQQILEAEQQIRAAYPDNEEEVQRALRNFFGEYTVLKERVCTRLADLRVRVDYPMSQMILVN